VSPGEATRHLMRCRPLRVRRRRHFLRCGIDEISNACTYEPFTSQYMKLTRPSRSSLNRNQAARTLARIYSSDSRLYSTGDARTSAITQITMLRHTIRRNEQKSRNQRNHCLHFESQGRVPHEEMPEPQERKLGLTPFVGHSIARPDFDSTVEATDVNLIPASWRTFSSRAD
jgi:hypothetical protein